MKAGGLEQGGEHLGGLFGAVEGNPGVPTAGVAIVAGDAADLSRLGAELLLGRLVLEKISTCRTGVAGLAMGGSAASGAAFARRSGWQAGPGHFIAPTMLMEMPASRGAYVTALCSQ
ncbi:MAG: hypothetical protein WAK82_44240 [Streptosporangiaceae bacterium]